MPSLTRWHVKTALLCLILALLLGILMALANFGRLYLPALFPVYLHVLVVGWITNLIFGVVYWMFPKYTRERPRGSEALGWFAFIALNLGLLARAIFEPLNTQTPSGFAAWGLIISALLQWMGGVAFAVNTWGRVKEK